MDIPWGLLAVGKRKWHCVAAMSFEGIRYFVADHLSIEGGKTLANVWKFDKSSAVGRLRHIVRDIKKPQNPDIDPARTHLNYSLAPERPMKPYGYLQKRLSEVYRQDRDDVYVMAGWIITKPTDLPDQQEEEFFRACYTFLRDRYGGDKNVIAAEVHKDESGQPHLHFAFVPTVDRTPNQTMVNVVKYFEQHPTATNITHIAKELGVSRQTVRRYRNMTTADIQCEKVCAKEVLTKAELFRFHDDLKAYLKRCGIDADVNSGITREQGGNRTVTKMKEERERLRKQEFNF